MLCVYSKDVSFTSNPNKQYFGSLGYGVLVDVISDPLITEVLNGSYILEFDYKIDGALNQYLVQENIIKNNNFKFFINTSKDKDSLIWDIEYSQGFLCKDFISHNNGTVEFTEYRDSQSIWNEENIDQHE